MGKQQTRRRQHRPMPFIPAYRNPVAKALAKHQMQQAARDERIATLMLEQDEDATDALAHLAWVIGMGAETAVAVHGAHSAATRRLHGALRTVEAMCLQHGYRWQVAHALALQQAVAESHELIATYPQAAAPMTDGANHLAGLIGARLLQPGAVAGAELYATAATTAPQEHACASTSPAP